MLTRLKKEKIRNTYFEAVETARVVLCSTNLAKFNTIQEYFLLCFYLNNFFGFEIDGKNFRFWGEFFTSGTQD